MARYFIEFRFQGNAKKRMKQMIYEVDRRFGLDQTRSNRPVPHISLAGGFDTYDEARLVRDFRTICEKTKLMNFWISGYGSFDNSRVVFIDIKPGTELDEFRWILANTLKSYCQLKQFDHNKEYNFHATIAMNLDWNRFEKIKEYISQKQPPNFKHFVLRVTLLKNSKILYEYDFLQRRMLDRREARDKFIYRKTISLLNEFFNGRHTPNKHLSGFSQPYAGSEKQRFTPYPNSKPRRIPKAIHKRIDILGLVSKIIEIAIVSAILIGMVWFIFNASTVIPFLMAKYQDFFSDKGNQKAIEDITGIMLFLFLLYMLARMALDWGGGRTSSFRYR